jgi:alginate O-acetyltransferase complex protein AlgI
MNLDQVELWFFLPAVWALYWLGHGRRAWQNAVLLASGYLFAWTWDPNLLWVLATSTALDFAAGLALQHTTSPRARRALLWASIISNLTLLAVFKYFNFFTESLDNLLEHAHLSISAPTLSLGLPIGISYYTFSKIAYIIEIYRNRLTASRAPLDFATWTSLFPLLTAGPITRPQHLLPQLASPRRLNPDQLAAGAAAFLLGFALKAYAADRLGPALVSPIMSAPLDFTLWARWLALLAYAAQIFSDFAGYSLMAIGLGRLFALELPENFRFPFLSTNLSDFWRRWHITLNTWLFDYLYGPLTLSRGWWRGRLDLAFLLVFTLSGLWHGPAWGYLLWGLMHGAALVLERRWDAHYKSLCRKDRAWVARRRSAPYKAASWALTQAWFVLSLLPFHLQSLGALQRYTASLFSHSGTLTPPGLQGLRQLQHIAAISLFLLLYHLWGARPQLPIWTYLAKAPPIARGIFYGLAIIYLFLFTPLSKGTFVYANF